METLGNQHFLDNIELIHEEKVLWQGGASRRGIAVQLLHFTGFILGIILVFAVVLGIPLFLYTENPDYPSETKIEMSQPETGDALNNHQKGAQQDDEPDPPKIILSTQRVIILLGSITPLIILTLLCIAWLRVKNYWFVITTERICIQSGIFRRQLVAIDIDKVVSVIATHTILDRIFKLHAIELIHAGVNFPMPNTNLLLFNPYKMFYVPVGTNLVSKLLTNWLPRDNQKK
ncbi:PH domain-containing protein [Kaarinaea lacus]